MALRPSESVLPNRLHPSEVVVASGQTHLAVCDAGAINLRCCGSHWKPGPGAPRGSLCECDCHRKRWIKGEEDDTAHLKAIVSTLARHTSDGSGVPLWSVISDLIGCGSGMAARVVRRMGHDPESSVLKPSWYDPTKTSIQGWCDKHQSLYDLSESCNNCDAESESKGDT